MAVTKDMRIAEVVQKHPETVHVMLSYGLHCVGCAVGQHETIEQGCLNHGMKPKDIESLVNDMNAAVDERKNQPDLALTDTAVHKLNEFMQQEAKGEQGVRVVAVPGGNEGFTYDMQFEKEPGSEDRVIKHRGIKMFVDKDSLEIIRGSTIDFVEDTQGGGFKVNNPNITTCRRQSEN